MKTHVNLIIVLEIAVGLTSFGCGESLEYDAEGSDTGVGVRCQTDLDCADGLTCVEFTPGYESCQCLSEACESGDDDSPRTAEAPLSRKVDILWVVDNSGSMCEEQQQLRDGLETFIGKLEEARMDYNIAVVSTDVEDPRAAGHFNNQADTEIGPSCQISVDIACDNHSPLVIRRSDPRYRLSSGELDVRRLEQDFACNVTVGTTGSGFEAGLEAARLALSEDALATFNAGFLRDDALLAVMFVSDENDCSDGGTLDKFNGNVCEWEAQHLVPVDEYIDFFLRLKPTTNGSSSRDRVVMAGVIAPDDGVRYSYGQDVDPSCITETGRGFSGYRYGEVVSAFSNPDYALANICEPFDWVLSSLVEMLLYDVVGVTHR